MTKSISIHKADFHKLFHLNSEENADLLEDILSVEMLIYPLEDKGCFYLYDLENKRILLKHNSVSKFKVDKNIEMLSLIGVSVLDVVNLDIPKKTNCLIFEGGDLMPIEMGRTKKGGDLWNEVINLRHHYNFCDNIDDRLFLDSELRDIYRNRISDSIADFGLSGLLEWVENSSIDEITFSYTYFSDSDFKLLSKLEQLKALSILYSYNDNLKWFPKNLTFLKIYGTMIQNLSEINLELPGIKMLDLEGNAINNLNGLSNLPSTLEELKLSRNLIRHFNISELPEVLEVLDLSFNLIDNDFFNQNIVNESLKVLVLSENEVVITSSILNTILEWFPKLECLELVGNEVDGIPMELLGNAENKNCLAYVQFWLRDIDYKMNANELILSSSGNLKDFVAVIWRQKSLPLNIIFDDLQDVFSKHFMIMPSFRQFVNGLYCFVTHDNCELFIKIDTDNNDVLFRVQSDNSKTVARYFHLYFHEVNRLVDLNSHLSILPIISCSPTCSFLEDFYLKVFKLDYQIKSKPVLKLSDNCIEVLINNRKIEEKEYRPEDLNRIQGKIPGRTYFDIDAIAFILVSAKSAYPFVIRNGAITNAIANHKDDYYYLTLSKPVYKDAFIKGISSKYLNSSRLEEVDVFVNYDSRKKVSCFVNSRYFHAKENILTAKNIESTNLIGDLLKKVKMDIGKYCEFNVVENLIELKYV